MKNASDKAAKLINEYMKEHPELVVRNIFKGKETFADIYEIVLQNIYLIKVRRY